MIKIASWGRMGLFSLHFNIDVHHQRKSGQEVKEGCCLLSSLLSLLSHRTQDYQPRDGITYNELGPPILISN